MRRRPRLIWRASGSSGWPRALACAPVAAISDVSGEVSVDTGTWGAGEGGTRQRWDLFIPHLRYPSGLMRDWCGGGRTCWTLSCCPVLTSPAPGVGAKVTCSEVTCDAGGMAFSLFPYIPDGVACGTPPPMPAMRWGEKGGAIDRAPAARVFARASGGGRAQLNAARSRAFVSASASVRSQVERQVVARGVFRFVTEGNFTTVPRVPLES